MIELTTGMILLASAFAPLPSDAKSVDAKQIAEAKPVAAFAEHPVTLETYVREYFKESPVLANIAYCESTFRQHDSKGNVLKGKVNNSDIGIMQINKHYHLEDAEKLGFDIYTLEGNLGYAKWLYGKYGDDPWVHSSKCWKKYSKVAKK